jgi:hypothetical protein
MAGQSSTMTVGEVCKTIKGLEHNAQTAGNGSCSGDETNQQVRRTHTPQPKKAK